MENSVKRFTFCNWSEGVATTTRRRRRTSSAPVSPTDYHVVATPWRHLHNRRARTMTSRRRSWHTATHLDGNGFLQAVPALSNGFGADSFVKQVNRRARATTRSSSLPPLTGYHVLPWFLDESQTRNLLGRIPYSDNGRNNALHLPSRLLIDFFLFFGKTRASAA